MLEHFFRSHERIQALREGPDTRCLKGLPKNSARRATPTTACKHIRAAEHLLHWSEREGIPVSDVTENLLERFHQHLERCRCPGFGPTQIRLV